MNDLSMQRYIFRLLESKVVYAFVSLHQLTINFCSKNITRTKKEWKQCVDVVDLSKQVEHYVYVVEFSRQQERKQDKEK
jgi:hypothetical protein